MWGLRQFLLVSTATLLLSSALSAPTEAKHSSVVTRVASNRSLRSAYTFDVADADDANSEERASNLASLKDKAAKLTSKLTRTSSMSKKLQDLAKGEGKLDDLKVVLKMDKLDDAMLVKSSNFGLYDDFLTAQVPRWSEKNLPADEVKKLLGMEGVSERLLASRTNFKYYKAYVEKQIPVWVKQDANPLDIWKQLGLNSLKNDHQFLQSENFQLYHTFIKNDMEKWAMNFLTKEKVYEKMGIDRMTGAGKRLNQGWYDEYAASADRFRASGWYKENLSSYDVWVKMKVGAIGPTSRASSSEYKTYEVYAKKLDSKIEEAKTYGYTTAPNTFSKDATPAELKARAQIWAQTGKTDSFVKYALGINKLSDKKMQKHEYYKYFEEFKAASRGT